MSTIPGLDVSSDQIKSFKEFLLSYNKLSELCFNACANDFTLREVKPRELSCSLSCMEKYLKMNQRITQRFQEYQMLMNENAIAAGSNISKIGSNKSRILIFKRASVYALLAFSMEFAIGAFSAGCAVVFTNPLDVVKTRFQLQGELKAKGEYTRHYKNVFDAFFVIAKNDGILALQKGLVPAFVHQLALNGTRLGLYHVMENHKLVYVTGTNEVSVVKSVICSMVVGSFSGFVSSPFFLVKTHLQSKSDATIAVGHQHKTVGIMRGLLSIYSQNGVKGLWRGALSSVIRISVGSAVQYTCFVVCKQFFIEREIIHKDQNIFNAFLSGMIGGIAVALVMAPLDLIATRLYNQGVDSNGRGILYSGYSDCFVKTVKSEGAIGLYKGIGPCYLRIGPHTVLCFVFWDFFKNIHKKYYES